MSDENRPSGRSATSNDQRVASSGVAARTNRVLLIAVLSTVIAVLGVMSWLIYTVTRPAGAPRTAIERELTQLEALASTESTNPVVWANWATALVVNGQLDKAADVIARGKKATKLNAALRVAEARLLVARGRSDDALTLIEALIAELTKQMEKTKGDLAARGTLLDDSQIVSEALIDAAVLKGDLLLKMRRPKESVVSYSLALKYRENMADVLTARGDAYAALGDSTAAETDYRKALTMIPDYAQALAGLARIGKAAD